MKKCRHPKSKPYGTKGTNPYCDPHDQCQVYTVSKKAERSKAKKEISKELREKIVQEIKNEEKAKLKAYLERESFKRKLSF